MSDSYLEHEPIYFTSGQKEVWRVLPDSQKEQITRFTYGFSQGWSSYIYDRGRRGRRSGNNIDILSRHIQPIISQMVWQDLDLADGEGFPKMTPKRAMMLARLAQPIGSTLATGTPGRVVRASAEQCGTSLTGLHLSLLGSESLIRSELSVAILRKTASSLHDNVFNKVPNL